MIRGILAPDDPAGRKSANGKPLNGAKPGVPDGKAALKPALDHGQRYIEAIHDTTAGMSGSLDLSALLDNILARTGELLGTPDSYIYMVEGDRLRVIAGLGVFKDNIGFELKKGEGVAGTVALTGEVFAVDDYQAWPRRARGLLAANYHAVAGAPLRSGGAVIGVLGVSHLEGGRTFTSEELGQLASFAELASIAIENARLHAAAQQEVSEQKRAEAALLESERRFRGLYSLTNALNEAGDLESIYRDALAGLQTTMGADRAGIFFMDDAGSANFAAWERLPARYRRAAKRFAPWPKTATTPAPLLVEDVEAGKLEVGAKGIALREKIKAAAFIPLYHRGLLGGIGLYYGKPQSFSEQDVQLAVTMASHVALAVARKLDEKAVQASEERFRSLVQNSADVIEILETDGTFRFITPSVEPILGYTPEELHGTNSFELLDPSQVEEVRHAFEGMINDPSQSISKEVRVRRKDGSWADVEGTARNLLADPHIAGVVVNMRDIGERRRAAAAILASERRVRSMVQNASDITAILDGEGRNVYLSPSVERILGYTPDELIGRSTFEYMHPDDIGPALSVLGELLGEQGATRTAEVRMQHKDGSWRFLEAIGTNRLADPDIQGIVLNARDTTERRHTEVALLTSEERFRDLFENANDMVYTRDLDGRLTAVNRMAERLTGYSREELIGRPIADLLATTTPDEAMLSLDNAPADGFDDNADVVEFVRKDGQLVPAEVRARLIYKGGQPVAVQAIARDISDRVEAEDALKASEERFRTLVQNASDTVAIVDINGIITYQSPGIEGIAGYKPEELVGQPVVDFVHPDDIAAMFSAAENIRVPGSAMSMELRFRHRDGHWIHLEGSGRNLLNDPNIGGIVVNAHDVTQRKQAEQALQASEERFRELFENANDLVYIHDLEGNFVAVNNKAEEVTGYTPEEATGLNISTLLAPDSLDKARQIIARKVIEGVATTAHELEIVAKGGALVPLEVSTRLVYEDGEPVAVQGIARDIRARKEAERADAERIRLETLTAEVNAAFAETEGLREALQLTADAMVTHLDADLVRVWLNTTEDPDALQLQASSGTHADSEGAAQTIPTAVFGEPGNWLQLSSSEAPEPWPIACLLGAEPSQFCAYPIVVEGNLVGAIAAFAGAEPCESARQTMMHASDLLGTRIARRRAQEELERTGRRFSSLVENTSDIISVVSDNGTLTYLSPSVERITGYSPEELVGLNFFDLIPHDDAARGRDGITELLKTPGSTGSLEYTAPHRDGSIRQIEAVCRNLLDDPSIRGIVVNARDITERKQFEEELAHQAFYESLTGLPNRALFLDRLEHALSAATRGNEMVALLFLDLDRFKVINDSLGHSVGDQLLVVVGERLRGSLRPGDTVARFGGDEFTILLERVYDPTDALLIASRVIEDLSAPFNLHGHEMFISASIGIAFASAGASPGDLLRDADVALYRAKEDGRSRYVVFDEEMNLRAIERLDLENDLHRAMDRGEITVHYQPQIEIASGAVLGFEALARWEHPRHGFISPSEFIPIAEDNGLIISLGIFVLREACREAVGWQKLKPMNPPLGVSVNVSARQFQHPDLVEQVSAVLAETGLDPSSLTLEITESVAVQEAATVTERLADLKRLGVKLAIDDFGAGYSSLTYLTRLTIDSLKIDRVFISGIEADDGKAAIVRALISLANTLNLTVTAEGIESAAQLACLVDMECHRGQGYLFARPFSAGAAKEYLLERPAPAAPRRRPRRTRTRSAA
ncbi:MAG: PAS domain S-box protein [Dehalococcoidia bacterium]